MKKTHFFLKKGLPGFLITGLFFLYSFGISYADRAKKIFSLFPGTDGVYSFVQQDDFDYFRYPDYLIAVKKLDAGSDIYVKFLKMEEKYDDYGNITEQCDYLIKNERAEYFRGIYKNYLFVKSGSGAYPHGLQIYDIARKERVLITEYAPILYIDDKGIVNFWRILKERKLKEKDKKWRAAALSMEIQERILINLSDLAVTETGETRISPPQ